MTKYIDLKVDRSLIKTNFDGYKLSLESVPTITNELIPSQYPTIVKPSSDQYSYLHAELFSMQNLLVQDPWNRESSYYVGNNGLTIYCLNYKENTGRPCPLQTIYNFEKELSPASGCYPFSFKFVSEKFCLFCDGSNRLFLFDTGDRYKSLQWKLVFSQEIELETLGFLLKDARLDIFNTKKEINCILQHVTEDNLKHYNKLYLTKIYENEDNEWKYELRDILIGRGSLYYCVWEPKSASIILSSNKNFLFKSDFEKQEEKKEKSEVENVEKEELNFENIFSWTQTEDDVVISFKPIEYNDKDDFKVICTDETITVKCNEKILLENEKFYEKIDSELTTWTLENDFLQVTLMKKDCNIWPLCIIGGPVETKNDNTNDSEFPVDGKPIANLETPLEDCDTAMNTDEEFFIERLNLESKSITHKIHLGNTPPLFTTNLRPGFPSAIVTRSDVDASLWLQQYNPTKPTEWNLRHEGNLHAFGYIQASKQQKKFIDCAPDLSYSVICESFRHVFIYNSKYETASNLRNRNGPKITIGKQIVITLDQTSVGGGGEILGMSCGTNFIALLSEKCLIFIQLNKFDHTEE